MINEHISLVLVTVPQLQEARHIAQTLLAEKLVACVNILDNITSLYIWNGKSEESDELLLIMKTRSSLFPLLKNRIEQLHTYSVPEIVELPAANVAEKYHAWVLQETRTP